MPNDAQIPPCLKLVVFLRFPKYAFTVSENICKAIVGSVGLINEIGRAHV